METDYIQTKGIVTYYQKQIESLSTQRVKIELLSENKSVINPIYSSFVELNNAINLCEKYWKLYCFERDSIIDINNDICLSSFSVKQLKKLEEAIPKLIKYHSERANNFYSKYLECYEIKREKSKETQQALVSLFSSIRDIYPNFNKNIVFASCGGFPISFKQKSEDMTDSYFEINYKELINNIFKLATNQIDRESLEKKSAIVNVIAESIKRDRENDKPTILIKE